MTVRIVLERIPAYAGGKKINRLEDTALSKKYEVGILGVWSGCNYGSIATYYALHQVIASMGKSILMTDKPILSENDVERKETHARRFGREHYHISKQYRLEDLKELKHLTDLSQLFLNLILLYPFLIQLS